VKGLATGGKWFTDRNTRSTPRPQSVASRSTRYVILYPLALSKNKINLRTVKYILWKYCNFTNKYITLQSMKTNTNQCAVSTALEELDQNRLKTICCDL